MQHPALLSILEQEGSSFYRITNRWQPKGLFPDPLRRKFLLEAKSRLIVLEAAELELRSLDRVATYVNALKRMRLALKAAQFAWRVDDLRFLQSIARFFSDYGTVLQHLKIDKARGRLNNSLGV